MVYLYSIIGLFLLIYILINSIVLVKEGSFIVIERLGRFHKVKKPGIRFLVPILDKIKSIIPKGEILMEIPSHSVLTNNNATVDISGTVFYKIVDPVKALYNVTNLENALLTMVTTEIRAVVGELSLKEANTKRDLIKASVEEKIHDRAVNNWGVEIISIQIKEIDPTKELRNALEKKEIAAREKEAATIRAMGQAEASKTITKALAENIKIIKEKSGVDPESAMKYVLSKEYLEAMGKIASKEQNTTVMFPTEHDAIHKLFELRSSER